MLRARLRKLEAARGPAADPERVRVVIVRRIVEGGAADHGEDWQSRPVRVVQREFDLYPEGLPGRWSK